MMRETIRDAFGLTILFLIVTIPLWTQSAHPGFDADGFFAPFFMLAAQHAREGQFFLWDPWTTAGLPACAHPELGVFSPFLLSFGVVLGPTYEAFLAYWLFFWWLGGIGMMVLARHLGAPRWGAFIAASGFFLSGFFTGHGQTTSWVHAFAGLPWILWRLDVSLRDGRWWPAIEAGAIWGFFGLAGYPPIQLSNLAIVWFWALAASAASWGAKTRAILLMTAAGAVVLSPSYVSFALNGRGYSDRVEGISRAQALDDNALDPKALLTFSSPYLATIPRVLRRFDPNWINTDIWSMSMYAGGVCWGLAAAGFALRPLERQRLALLTIGVVGLLLAMGRDLPFRGWLFDYVPPSRFFRHASLFANTYHFALPALAALGARDLVRESSRWWRLAVAWPVLAAAAMAAFYSLMAPLDFVGGNRGAAQVHLGIVWGGLALLGLASGLVSRGGMSERAWLGSLVTLACFDVSLGTVLSYPMFLGDARENWQVVARNRRHSLDLLDNKPRICNDVFGPDAIDKLDIGPLKTNKHSLIGQPRLDGYNTLSHSTFTDWLNHAWFRDLATGPNRFWFTAVPTRAPDTPETRKAFVDRASRAKKVPAIIEGDGDLAAIDDAEFVSPIAVTLREYRPTTLTLECDAPKAGWLIVTDRWAPGWTARVNGEPTAVARAEFFFRAVPVAAGRNLVKFTYEPLGYLPWLVGLSWGTLLAVLLGGVAAWWRQPAAAEPIRSTPSSDLDERLRRRLNDP